MSARPRARAGDVWGTIRRHRLTIAVCTVLGAALGLALAFSAPPVYRATAAVLYEPSATLTGLLSEVLSIPRGDAVETQMRVITSTPVLEQVATRITPPPGSGEGGPTAPLAGLHARIETARVPSTSIIEITARAPSAREARDLADAVATAYRDYNRMVRNARVSEARRFLEREVREVEARLTRSEEDLWSFRSARGVIAPGAESTVLLLLLEQVRSELERTRQRRAELEVAQRRLARSETAGEPERVAVDVASPTITWLQRAQAALNLEREAVADELPPGDPDRQALQERLRDVSIEMRREVGAHIALLQSREEVLNRSIADLNRRSREVPPVELGLQRLQREAKTNDDLLTWLRTRRQEALIKEAEAIEEVTILKSATEPAQPSGPGPVGAALFGGLLGVAGGLAIAGARSTLGGDGGRIADVESRVGLPLLAVVPHLDAEALLVAHADPGSPVAQAYRSLLGSLRAARAGRSGRVVVVSAPVAGQGVTTTAVNLALTTAREGERTLLVETNLRDPRVHAIFGLDSSPGLAQVLAGTIPWRDAVRTVTDMLMGRLEMEDAIASPGLDSLHVVTAGTERAGAADPGLLASPALARFLGDARQAYDVVIVDAPPVLTAEETAAVVGHADGVILVSRDGALTRRQLRRARARLEEAGANVWGVVANDARPAGRSWLTRKSVLLVLPALLLVVGLVWTLDLAEGPRSTAVLARQPVEPDAPPAAEPPSAGPEAAAKTETAASDAAAATAASEGRPSAPADRFAVELGPFRTAEEAQQVERQMSQAGYQTVRFRQPGGGALYAVLVEGVRVGELLPLHDAVQRARRLRADGHTVRVLVQQGQTDAFVVRHGNFVEREEAESRRGELALVGLAASVVQVR